LSDSLLFELHQDLPREGPGDDESTRRALSLVTDRALTCTCLDIGCGPGMQTIALASATRGRIVAVDTHRPYLARLRRAAQAQSLDTRISVLQASMFRLPFGDVTFDVIWSEGAIYLMGFERGLREWRRLLRPRGVIAVTELSWLQPHRPDELVAFWQTAYPGLQSVEDNLADVRAAGYRDLGHFVLPESSWWKNYYGPLERRAEVLRERHAGDPDVISDLDRTAREIDLFRRHSSSYGYVFFVMQATQ
jgi:SAM-dependent methyltransferase